MELCLTNEAKKVNCKELDGLFAVKVNGESVITREQIEQLIKEAKILYWLEN